MTDQHLRISFSDLPSRTRPLGDAELSKVLGGACGGGGAACTRDLDCCYGKWCKHGACTSTLSK